MVLRFSPPSTYVHVVPNTLVRALIQELIPSPTYMTDHHDQQLGAEIGGISHLLGFSFAYPQNDSDAVLFAQDAQMLLGPSVDAFLLGNVGARFSGGYLLFPKAADADKHPGTRFISLEWKAPPGLQSFPICKSHALGSNSTLSLLTGTPILPSLQRSTKSPPIWSRPPPKSN